MAAKKRPTKKKSSASARAVLRKNRRDFERQSSRQGGVSAELLASGVAHEFNNILGAADGHAEWALESGDPLEMRAALEVVRIACARSAQITRALQGFAQPREEARQKTSLIALAAELTRIYGPLCHKEFVELSLDLTARTLRLDEGRIFEVFSNLIKNSLAALRSSPQNLKKISVRGQATAKKLQILFEDNGEGVPEIYRAQLFEPFFTTKGVLGYVTAGQKGATSAANKMPPPPREQGSGLGLFLSKQIAEEHGGTLKFLPPTRDWPGARFELILPL